MGGANSVIGQAIGIDFQNYATTRDQKPVPMSIIQGGSYSEPVIKQILDQSEPFSQAGHTPFVGGTASTGELDWIDEEAVVNTYNRKTIDFQAFLRMTNNLPGASQSNVDIDNGQSSSSLLQSKLVPAPLKLSSLQAAHAIDIQQALKDPMYNYLKQGSVEADGSRTLEVASQLPKVGVEGAAAQLNTMRPMMTQAETQTAAQQYARQWNMEKEVGAGACGGREGCTVQLQQAPPPPPRQDSALTPGIRALATNDISSSMSPAAMEAAAKVNAARHAAENNFQGLRRIVSGMASPARSRGGPMPVRSPWMELAQQTGISSGSLEDSTSLVNDTAVGRGRLRHLGAAEEATGQVLPGLTSGPVTSASNFAALEAMAVQGS